MTVKELKELIKDLPDDLMVAVDQEEFEHAVTNVNSAKRKTLDWEMPNGELQEVEVFVLQDY